MLQQLKEINYEKLKKFIMFVWPICFFVMVLGMSIAFNSSQNEELVITTDSNLQNNNKPTSRWRLNSNGLSQRYIHLTYSWREERMRELLSHYGHENYEVWRTIARIHKIYPETLICIAYADSSLGKYLKTKNNIGNVFNTDSGQTKSFEYIEQGIDAIGRYALNGSMLKHKSYISELSPAHWKPWPYYATSPENWDINVMNCLGMIYDKDLKDFYFRF